MFSTRDELDQWVAQAKRLWLFLDYDGTLADFAPAPAHIEPDREIVDLLTHLSGLSMIRVAVISGRRLSDVQTLLPVPGIFLAGVYGVEVQAPTGEIIRRVEYERVRPLLERLKPLWTGLIASQSDFYLEDKGWSLALHTPVDRDAETELVLSAARQVAGGEVPLKQFRWIGGHKFLEIAPVEAHKGATVDYLLHSFPWPEAHLLYIGDDDQDAQAFEFIHVNGGIAILVTGPARPLRSTHADYELGSPWAVRRWLQNLVQQHPDNDFSARQSTGKR